MDQNEERDSGNFAPISGQKHIYCHSLPGGFYKTAESQGSIPVGITSGLSEYEVG
ncbi:MAG: hypothetical protein NPIRA03_07380 [Nitrospirales bacterium]|nr:MAG: hypothetical protein NPIRA03_07380 [Nitrospirales bacterium]